jgi:hypothetical protein
MKRLPSNRLSHLAIGATFPTEAQKKARAELEAEQAEQAKAAELIEIHKGEEIARVLQLRRSTEHPDRWNTTHGTKTSLGLARTLRGLLGEEGEYLNPHKAKS